MSAAVEVGARSTRKGAKLHILGGCRWANVLPLIGKLETLTTTNADRACRNCRKAIRTTLDTAQAANKARTANTHQVKIEKIETEGHLTALLAAIGPQVTVEQIVTAPGHDEEIARIEAVHAKFWAEPVEPVEAQAVPEISKLGQFAASLGVVPNQAQPITVTRKSQRGRLALHRSFAHAA